MKAEEIDSSGCPGGSNQVQTRGELGQAGPSLHPRRPLNTSFDPDWKSGCRRTAIQDDIDIGITAANILPDRLQKPAKIPSIEIQSCGIHVPHKKLQCHTRPIPSYLHRPQTYDDFLAPALSRYHHPKAASPQSNSTSPRQNPLLVIA